MEDEEHRKGKMQNIKMSLKRKMQNIKMSLKRKMQNIKMSLKRHQDELLRIAELFNVSFEDMIGRLSLPPSKRSKYSQ